MNAKTFPSALFLILICFSFTAQAFDWDQAVRDNSFLQQLFGRSACQEDPKEQPDQSADKLWAKILKLQSQGKGCEAADLSYELMRQHPVAPWWKKAWMARIDSLVIAQDWILMINEANQFLDEMPGAKESEEVHFKILSAVRTQMIHVGAKRTPEWTEFALEIARGQHEKNPYLVRMSFQNYLDLYPRSARVATVKAWQKDARDRLCAHFLEIAKFYLNKKEYVAAMGRLGLILEGGLGIASFPEALYEMIHAQWEFAKLIPSLSDARLRELLQDPHAASDRAALAKETRQQALSLLKEMEEKLPSNQWTAKARSLVHGL